MAADPTLEFLASLDDPTRWVIRRNVPIFKPHTRHVPGQRLPDGRVIPPATITVTEDDLPEIADNCRELERSGVLLRLTPGHVSPYRGDETEQPPLYGVCRVTGVGRFGPSGEPCILADEYVRREHATDRRNYPYRSADYYPAKKVIRGVALLKQEPALDLGMVAYADGPCYHYAMGDTDMPADAMGPTDADTPKPADGDADKYSPEEEAQYERMCRYMRVKYGLHDTWPGEKPVDTDRDDAATMEPNAGSDELRGKNQAGQIRAMNSDGSRGSNGDGGRGNPNHKDSEGGYYQSGQLPVQYQRQIAIANQRIAALEADRERERCRAMLYSLAGDGFRLAAGQFEKELARLVKTPPAERPDRIGELRLIYAAQQMPVGGRIELFQDRNPVEGGSPEPDPNDPYAAPKHHDAAVAYMLAHPGMGYEQAYAHVAAGAGR